MNIHVSGLFSGVGNAKTGFRFIIPVFKLPLGYKKCV
jgi:hypothetical protein